MAAAAVIGGAATQASTVTVALSAADRPVPGARRGERSRSQRRGGDGGSAERREQRQVDGRSAGREKDSPRCHRSSLEDPLKPGGERRRSPAVTGHGVEHRGRGHGAHGSRSRERGDGAHRGRRREGGGDRHREGGERRSRGEP